ncbi:MAG: histidine kinase dimerization/phospho-acceptor domain-containing protein [Myxococcota bacterium]
MASFWIVHRDARARAALARIAGAGDDSVLGSPTDSHFESLEAPDLVLLGLSGDLELELEFAHRFSGRLTRSRWLLFAEPRDGSEVGRLFDTIPAEVIAYPPQPEELRERIRAVTAVRRADSLSQRHARDAVAARFSRYFGDLELPELLRAVDPRLGEVPLLVRGEVGTGRAVLARYVHAFGGTTGGVFRAFDCEGTGDLDVLRDAIERAAEGEEARSALTLCFEEVDRLPQPLQRELSRWIELSPPPAALRPPRLRFMATAGDPELSTPSRRLDPRLASALSGLALRIPPLRRRPGAVASFATGTVRAWCQERGNRQRTLDPESLALLGNHPWPGNLRELEGVLIRTLASVSADPIRPEHLRFEAVPPEPVPEATREPLAAQLEVDGEELDSDAGGGLPEVVASPEPGESLEPGPAGPEPTPSPVVIEPEIEAEEPEPYEAEPEAQPQQPELAPATAPELGAALQRLASAVAHEVRNPLVAIRTFAELLPERFEDEEFRTRFAESVRNDVRRLEIVTERLSRLGSLSPRETLAVDVARILDDLLEARREELQARRVLVLKELDRNEPFAVGDPGQLRLALDCLLDKALSLVPERGDAYVASKHHPSGLRGAPAVRILLRFQGPAIEGDEPAPGLTVAAASLDLIVSQVLVRAQGGSFHLDSSDAGETVVVIDLPAPA